MSNKKILSTYQVLNDKDLATIAGGFNIGKAFKHVCHTVGDAVGSFCDGLQKGFQSW